MTKKQIKSEFPNEVDLLRTTLAEVKVKLPGVDIFLLANPECTKCSNSKDYHCVQLKGKPGCLTCTSRRISCSRHVQYLVETTASRLEWSLEKTMTMYDKHVKQTRSGKKSLSKVKKVANRKAMVAGAVDLAVAGGSGGRRNVAAPEEDDFEGGSDYQDEAQRAPEDLEDFSDEPEEVEEDEDHDIDGNESTSNNIPHSISNATLRNSSSKPRALPSNLQEEAPTSHSQVTISVLEPEGLASLDPGLHDSTSLRIGSENPLTASQTGEGEHNKAAAAVPGAQGEHAPESSISAERHIKLLEEKVAKLNALRLVDAASISRLTKKADTAFDNMSVLLSRVHMHRQELGTIVTRYIETAHQKPFKSLIDKMEETSSSATQILMLLDKRKNYVMPKTRVPVVITDEEGQEWVPWDVISDDSILQDGEMDKKRRRDNGTNGEGSSKRRKC